MLRLIKGHDPLHPRFHMVVDEDGGGGGGGGGDDDADDAEGVETWHSKLPEDMRSDPSLVDFKDETEMIPMPLNVARSFINTKKLVGRDKIPMPKTTEEWDETYNRLGRPEAASQYNITAEGIEDDKLKEAFGGQVEWFKELAHKTGLSDAQAEAIWKGQLENSKKILEGTADGAEEIMRASEAELRATYGNNFEGKMVLMNRGIAELDSRVGGGLKDMIKGAGLAQHSKFVQAMVMVGEMMSEDLGLDKNTGGPAFDAGDLDNQISTLQASDEYLKANHPGHKVAVEKVANLMQIKHGKKPVDTLTRQSFVT